MDEMTEPAQEKDGRTNEEGPDIELLEVEPDDSWFVETQDQKGRPVVYLRVQVTGLLPRRAGPFPNRETALDALDCILNEISSTLDCNWEDHVQERAIRGEVFQHRWSNIVVEDELGQAYLHQGPPTPRPSYRQNSPPKRE